MLTLILYLAGISRLCTYSTNSLTGLKKFNRSTSVTINNYDITIHYLDPGFYLPVLCTGKTGKILTINEKL